MRLIGKVLQILYLSSAEQVPDFSRNFPTAVSRRLSSSIPSSSIISQANLKRNVTFDTSIYHSPRNNRRHTGPQTLGACIVPLPSEVDHIRNIISGAESDLFQLETEVARVQVVLRHLSRQLDETRTKITVHKALLSPIRRLPDELLSEIFIHCLPDQRKMDAKHDSFRIGEAPLLLGSVCGRWRVVSLATQELWSFVRVNFTSHTIEFAAEKAKVWLERAGTRLLSVTLSLRDLAFHPFRRIDAIDHTTLFHVHRLLQPLSPHNAWT